MDQTIITPRRPTGPRWKKFSTRFPELDRMGFVYEVWAHHTGLGVISAVETVENGQHYHLSINGYGGRPSVADALWVLGQFDLVDAKESEPVGEGMVRNFWYPVERQRSDDMEARP
jgi:hypothetical protein